MLAYLAPERGDFLEYDLTRMIYDLSHPDKPVVAVLGDLPMLGSQFNQFNQFDQSKPWLVLDAMYQFFDVRFLGGKRDRIDDQVDILMLAQPQELDDATRYAIDQFVMRGGRVLAFVDPFAEAMASGGNPAASGRRQRDRGPGSRCWPRGGSRSSPDRWSATPWRRSGSAP